MNSFPTPMLCCGSSMGKKKAGRKILISNQQRKEKLNQIKAKAPKMKSEKERNLIKL